MGQLDGKVAIITGASKGMGESHLRKFIAEGAKVTFTSTHRSVQRGQELAKELGFNAFYIEQNVADEASWKNVVEQTIEHFGKIDILVNNAGISINKSLFDLTLDDYMKIVNINQVSVFLGIKTVATKMKENDGSIINISSIDGLVGGKVGYTDTKFAVTGITKAAALELAPYNIRVNSVHPGVIDTPMIHDPALQDSVQQFIKKIPLQRVAQPSDVSNMVAFLASDASSYATGSSFIVDGGLTAK